MTKDNFSNGLMPSGWNINHKTLSENIQDIKTQTRLRRVEPFCPSEIEILGDFYQCGGEQLEKKAPHLKDFDISYFY